MMSLKFQSVPRQTVEMMSLKFQSVPRQTVEMMSLKFQSVPRQTVEMMSLKFQSVPRQTVEMMSLKFQSVPRQTLEMMSLKFQSVPRQTVEMMSLKFQSVPRQTVEMMSLKFQSVPRQTVEMMSPMLDRQGTLYHEGHPEPVPEEIGLLILANKGPRVPQIIQLLDWVEEPEQYIMILELPKPCEDLLEYYNHLEGEIEESLASVIMKQATLAAQTCCQRGVLHRDIKLENLLINLDTLEVKLIDFGCGEILTKEEYTSFSGTEPYGPPEFDLNGTYHGEPATVWSLGVVLYALMCGEFPESDDLDKLNDNVWAKEGLTQDEDQDGRQKTD
ncbi:unnamed protein product [Leuciscus chuanchicus]